MFRTAIVILGALVPLLLLDSPVSPRLVAQGNPARLSTAFGEVDRLLTDFATRTHVPGAAWGIVVNGELAHTGATGSRNLTTKAPADADTVFRIASMTKSFTAMSILQLRDAGKLSLDDPAEKYVPELAALKYPTTDSPKITIRLLLSHSTGFPEDNPWGDRQLSRSDDDLTRMLRSGIPFSTAPGTAYEYSNYGFAILGRVVTVVSGMPYDRYVTANILRPLGMMSTTLEASSVAPERLAHGYRWEDERWKEEAQLPHGSFGSMGGMLTTIHDLSKYVAMFLSAWPPHDGPETAPLRRASLREMQQLWRSSGASVTRDGNGALHLTAGGYAFGLRVSQSCSFRYIVSHTGGLPGFGSIMQWLPDYGVGIIAFGNLTYTGWGGVTAEAFDALARSRGPGSPGEIVPRMPEPSKALVDARDAVSRLVNHWDDRAADQIAAENLFLDRSRDRRRKAIEDLHAEVGACTPPDNFDRIENALRGSWTMKCERGALRVAITLAPTMPPAVQSLRVTRAAATSESQPSSTDACP